ncbi:MAG TPA: alanine racemase [Pyrinomonadaceae bacterium]|nr:alanine racemase [Pyrinomonadaceae bacterium]
MQNTDVGRPTWAEISLENLAFNLNSARDFIGREIRVMGVVKADAYGHGAVECAKRLEAESIDWLAVALPEEGVQLRQAGIKKPILCLGSFWSGQEKILLYHDLTPIIYRIEDAERLNNSADESGITKNIHIKIDTGMGRVGVRYDAVAEFAKDLTGFPSLRVDGLMTHFASADDLSETDFTNLQIERFETAVDIFRELGLNPTNIDLANSPGAIVHPKSRGNMVRLGGILYGLGDDVLPKDAPKPEFRPVLSLRTQIAHLKKVPMGETLGYGRAFTTARDSLIATIPVGYADGYGRRLSGHGRAIVNGRFVQTVGRISMDWTLLDVTDAGEVAVGDEVTLIGESNGREIRASELAAVTGTISYEITCGISQRVPRRYDLQKS